MALFRRVGEGGGGGGGGGGVGGGGGGGGGGGYRSRALANGFLKKVFCSRHFKSVF